MITVRYNNNKYNKVHILKFHKLTPYSKKKNTMCGMSMWNKETIVAQVDNIGYITCKRCLRTQGLTT